MDIYISPYYINLNWKKSKQYWEDIVILIMQVGDNMALVITNGEFYIGINKNGGIYKTPNIIPTSIKETKKIFRVKMCLIYYTVSNGFD